MRYSCTFCVWDNVTILCKEAVFKIIMKWLCIGNSERWPETAGLLVLIKLLFPWTHSFIFQLTEERVTRWTFVSSYFPLSDRMFVFPWFLIQPSYCSTISYRVRRMNIDIKNYLWCGKCFKSLVFYNITCVVTFPWQQHCSLEVVTHRSTNLVI